MAGDNEPVSLSSKAAIAAKVAAFAATLEISSSDENSQVLRDTILTNLFDGNATPMQRASVSAAAGGIAGGATTYTLVSRRFAPAFVTLGLGGFIGQKAYDPRFAKFKLRPRPG
ncbi:hypothetical protein KEM56_006282 [Ascosphaera pollenicola]|nr:hypothetical protein KEM56_006282 [Ascosphaera pollenicola]